MKDQMLNVAGTCSCVVVIQCCRLDSPRLICCPYLRMTWIVSFKGETSVSTDPRHFTWMMTPPPSLRNTPRSVDFLCAVQTNISQQVTLLVLLRKHHRLSTPSPSVSTNCCSALRLGFGCRCPCTSFSAAHMWVPFNPTSS